MNDDFRIDIGRADKGRTFIRVAHLPSGKGRIVVGLNGHPANKLIAQLQAEIRKE